MEVTLKQLTLTQDTVEALDYLRKNPDANVLFGLTPEETEQAFRETCLPLLQGASIPAVLLDNYRWFLRELAKQFRDRKGNDLCFNVELTMSKWLNLGLETRTMQFLVCEVLARLKAREATSGAGRTEDTLG